MRLKVVGGLNDGQVASLPEGQRSIVLTQVISEDSKMGLITYEKTRYTVRTLKRNSDHKEQGWEINYLAPESWTDLQALECQFSK